LIMFVSVMVNQTEMPFARSLISCDTPVSTEPGALQTGSKLCGDRLKVVGEGARLSGLAAFLENMCKCAMILFIGFFADFYGRKPAFLLGLAFVNLSVILFIVATFVPQWAYALFILGQGLQGLLGAEMLISVVSYDLAQRPGEESAAIIVSRDQSMGTGALFGMVIGNVVLGLELTDYTLVWVFVLAIACFIFVFAWNFFPETRPETASNDHKRSIAEIVNAELGGYRQLVALPVWKWIFLESVSYGPILAVFTIVPPWLMATYGNSQARLALFMFFIMVWGILTNPCWLAVCKKFGYRHGHRWMNILRLFNLIPILFGYYSVYFVWAHFFIQGPFSGQVGIVESVRLRLIGDEMNAKYNALDKLGCFFCTGFGTYVYSQLFDENATTYFSTTRPFIFLICCVLVNACLYLYPLNSYYMECLDMMQAQYDAEKAAAAETAAVDANKKTE